MIATIESNNVGPGTQLKLITPAQFFACPKCDAYACQMDQWGTDGCEERFEEIVNYWTERGKSPAVIRRLPMPFNRHIARGWVWQAIDQAKQLEDPRDPDLDSWPFVWTYWAGGAKAKGERNELWYSMRLVQKWHPSARCIVVGDKPDWYEGEFLAKPRIGSRPHHAFKDCLSKLLLAAEHVPQFIWMMDDVYWVKPFTIKEAATPKYVRHVSQQRYLAWKPQNAWARTRAAAYQWLIDNNRPTYDFAAHMPQPFISEKLLAMEAEHKLMDNYRNFECLYFNCNHSAAAEDWGRKFTRICAPNQRVGTPHKVLNHTHQCFHAAMRDYLDSVLAAATEPANV